MQAAVGPAPLLGHPTSKQEPINFSRFQDVITQRSSFMGMNDFRREDEMQKRLDEREQMEEEEEEEMKEENMDTKEEEETVINNHNDNNNSNHTDEKVCDLSAKVAELHATLEALKRESEQKIEKLKAENEEATRAIERLQQQLKQQTEFNSIKNNLMNIKGESPGINPLLLGSPGGPPPTSLPSPGTNLEMFLLERAKALQTNPSLNSFGSFPGSQGFPIRSSLFPGPGLPNQMTNLENFGNKDVLNRWRSSIPNLPQNIQEDANSHVSPSVSPEKRDTSPDRPPSSIASNSIINGGSKPPSEAGTLSPRQTDSTSPMKSEESPIRDLSVQQMPHMSPMSPYNSSPHHLPPLMNATRIPKSDPMEGRLQDMLRYNMERDAGQALDTLGDSRRVRELLSVHNIGQRLFAKYVLGLSQGTVSELLSKPKSWDKLTEKGRDSYRKMHAWCYDEQAIMLLKSLIPRKGELVRPMSNSPLVMKSPHNATPGQEKSLHTNTDAAKLMSDAVRSQNPDITKEQNQLPENPQDSMSRVYREEFARIMGANNKGFLDASPHSQLLKPSFLGNPLFPNMEGFPRPPGDFHQALSMYQEELNRLQQNAIASAIKEQSERNIHTPTSEHPSDSLDAHTTPSDDVEIKKEIISTPKPDNLPPSHPMKVQQKQLFSTSPNIDDNTSGSPLQRMASITNALVSQPPSVSFGTPQRPLRNALPPITQQQFDRYSHLNTDETVRRIKEILSQYSISQRLFGEAVLGLSQGSVSDLLARPKPWHMLTQKGREPFIRMKIFLEDDGAVHRLVASQYKIAPDKLMRTGSYNSPLGMPPSRPIGKLPENLIRPPFENPLMPSTLRFGSDPNLSQSPQPLLDPLAAHRKMMSIRPPGFPPTSGPSLYEMAALTNELDTQTITTKVKEILLAHNVGQKLFGEFVLGLSQGSVSELLSKPKAWHMLSIKGREPFIRMQLWLNDPANMDKLLSVKNEKREASKRRHGVDSSSDRSSPLDTLDDYSNPPSETGSLAKKSRAFFSEEQREALNIAFALDPYPSNSAMDYLSNELNLEVKSITNWFHNHRMRLKQIHGVAVENLISPGEGQSFDPAKFKLLLNHRKLEMQGNSSFPFLPGFNPAAFGLQNSGGLDSGLDLRYKTIDDDIDGEMSDSGSDKKDNDDKNEISDERKSPNSVSENAPRSRRKPAAPQWVNPEWPEGREGLDAGSEAKQEPINGVCVRNIPAYGEENSENLAEDETS